MRSQFFILLGMQSPESMIDRPESNTGERRRVDRLAAFFEAFPLQVHVVAEGATVLPATSALHLVAGATGHVESVVLVVRGNASQPRALVSAEVTLGGTSNPLLSALPDVLSVPLDADNRALNDTVRAFLAEASAARCGHLHALNRLGEVIVLMALRAAIEAGSTRPCLLAGLAHPRLHPVLVAMHESPAHGWSIDEMASVAGMSRSRFMALFPQVVGTTPTAYLTRWRLQLGQRELQRGGAKVKAVARHAGFASAEAFSRAYSREFGHAPSDEARA